MSGIGFLALPSFRPHIYNGLLTRSMTAISSPSTLPLRLLSTPFNLRYDKPFRFVIAASVSSILSDIWDSLLRAVPKKKTSHMKKRHRQMAGKALKDNISLNKCSSCGQPKRAHLLCPTCVSEIKQQWRKSEQTAA